MSAVQNKDAVAGNAASLEQIAKPLAARISDHLFKQILPFWCGPALDHEQGGWMGWLSNDLKPDRTQPKGLILNARILWTFSAVHRVRHEGLNHEMADRALDFVMNKFWDAKNGGAFWQLDDAGRMKGDHKKIYGQAFYIYALAEYHQAFNSAPALARAKETFELVERHGHEPKYGGYLEVFNGDWSDAGSKARLSDKDLNAKKSMNTCLHVLEAYTNLYRVWKEPRLAERLRELVDIFEQNILDARTFHFNSFFDENWKALSDSYTFGHDIEGSWLLCEAAEALGDTALQRRMEQVAVRMAEVTLKESIHVDGGLCYEGKAGKIIDHGREWWPQAEALVGFINAGQLSGDQKYLTAAAKVWNYIEQKVIDHTYGEWFWRINEDGKPDPKLPKVSEWKCPYHNSRACLEAMRRLNGIAERGK
jgi:mannobiose 2-epimerase